MKRATRLIALCAVSALIAAGGCKKANETTTSSGAKATNANANNMGATAMSQAKSTTQMASAEGGKGAEAKIEPAKGAATQPSNKDVMGTVTFTQESGGVKVVVDLTGLSPGKHGIHIHEKGDLSDAHLASTGGHWDPDMHKHHGGTSGEMRHAGDLGNLDADASGKAHLDEMITGLTVGDGGNHDVVGHAVVIHAGEDDLKSNPAGNSGGRIAGGVIEKK
jgi:superoxide dismutase, Cu-Zn family